MIYFTRHGQSVANVADRNGEPRPQDSDRLSERGWEQARDVGRRLRGEGIEAIVASHYKRGQETATAIGEILGIEIEVDPDLHEVRQSDAFYASSPDFGQTGNAIWMPTAEPDFAEPGAESFNAVVARVRRVQDRLAARADDGRRVLAVSHWGFLHFFLGVTLFDTDFSPAHLLPLYRVSHANTGISIFERRDEWEIDGARFGGWALTTWNDQGHL
jgi:broad specificity phosphatase PhoE